MSQTSYSQYQQEYILGNPVNGDTSGIESGIVKDQCYVGRGVCKVVGKEGQYRNFANNQVKLVFVGDLITANVVNLKVNGSAISPVTFNTDHATTMGLLATAIAAKTTYVASASVTSAREITVTGIDNTVIALTDIVVTLGSTQTTGSQTNGTRDTLQGIVVKTHSIEASDTDVVPSYAAKDVANIGRKGQFWVYFETTFNPDSDTLYVRYIDGGTGKAIGQFSNTADSNTCVAVTGNFRVLSHLGAAGVGKLEINKPN